MRHRLFLTVLALGALVRLVTVLGFPPALVYSDGPWYLIAIDTLSAMVERPVGYVLLLLYPAAQITANLTLVVVVQHLGGLAAAVALYALLRRWEVGPVAATLATVPVLFDTLQLVIEQSVLSDSLFSLLLVLTMTAVGWNRRPTWRTAVLTGLLLGLATTVRIVGLPLVVPLVLAVLLLGSGWRRLVPALLVVAAFLVPVGGYAAWYDSQHGHLALSDTGGRPLYARVSSFVDCSHLRVPAYQRVLCPAEPLGQREDPTYYAFHDPRTLPRLVLPAGVPRDVALRQFAVAAMSQERGAYVRTAARDLLLNFDVRRVDRFEFDTAKKWTFARYADLPHSQISSFHISAARGGTPHARAPFAQVMKVYGFVVYTPGPVLALCLLAGLVRGLWVLRRRPAGRDVLTLLLSATALGILAIPVLTAEFVWRYQMPVLVLLPPAAALAWTSWRARRRPVDPGQDETVATASTV